MNIKEELIRIKENWLKIDYLRSSASFFAADIENLIQRLPDDTKPECSCPSQACPRCTSQADEHLLNEGDVILVKRDDQIDRPWITVAISKVNCENGKHIYYFAWPDDCGDKYKMSHRANRQVEDSAIVRIIFKSNR